MGRHARRGFQLSSESGAPNYGFSMVRVQRAIAPSYSFIHESGHNMGAHHHKEQLQAPGPGLFDYSAGWRWQGDDAEYYVDIMAYRFGMYWEDEITSINTPYFSNPDVSHQGAPTGHPLDGDNARTIREIRHVIAAYRPQPDPLPVKQEFAAQEDTYGVATDGNFIFASSKNSGIIHRYEIDGTHQDHFELPGISKLYDLCHDGEFFYGSDGSSNIFQMDFQEKHVVQTISTTVDSICGIAYDPAEDAFWLSSHTEPGKFFQVNRVGELIHSISINNDAATVTGIAHDRVSENGPFLWVSAYDENKQSPYKLFQVKVPEGIQTGIDHQVGAVIETSGQPGGLAITSQILPGKWAFLGLIQNDRIWVGESVNLLVENPHSFTARSDEKHEVKLDFDTNVPGLFQLPGNLFTRAGCQSLCDV